MGAPHVHSYDEGVVTTPAAGATAGEKTYTCTACPQTKTEEIPATGATTTSYEFSQLTTGAFTENLTIDENIVVTATSAKKMQIKSGSATVGDTTFTNFLYLEGKANTDSRHIAITVDGPCTVTLYVAANGATQIAMYTSTANITDGTPEIVYDITTTAAAYTFTVEEAGTYYFGTPSSSAYVYGIDITVVS